MPEDDQFMTITEHEAANFRYGATYMNIARSDDLVFIQITANNTRPGSEEGAVPADHGIAGREPRPSGRDVFVNIVEVAKENWSFGHGLAQYAESRKAHARRRSARPRDGRTRPGRAGRPWVCGRLF